MLAFLIDVALILTTFFLGLAIWRLGTVAQRIVVVMEHGGSHSSVRERAEGKRRHVYGREEEPSP